MIKKFLRWLTKPIRYIYHLSVATRELLTFAGACALVWSGIMVAVDGSWIQFAAVCFILAAITYSDIKVNDE